MNHLLRIFAGVYWLFFAAVGFAAVVVVVNAAKLVLA